MLKLIIGGQGQGKLSYALSSPEYETKDVGYCEKDDLDNIFEKKIIYGIHHMVKRLLENGNDPKLFVLNHLEDKNIVIIGDEIGCGLIPIDAFERNYRDIYGEIITEIVKKSSHVERVFAGIPQTLKFTVCVALIRHGKTMGNITKVYHGRTNQSLSTEGAKTIEFYKENGIYPNYSVIYTSPLKRCLETSKIIFGERNFIVVNDLSECNFGEFEGKTHEEIISIKGFETFGLDVNKMAFPQGETVTGFADRCVLAFKEIASNAYQNNISEFAVVCHGGVIMTIMNRLVAKKEQMYDWHVENGLGFVLQYDIISHKGVILEKFCKI